MQATSVTSIVEYSKTEAALSELMSLYKDAQYDVTTRAGMGLAVKARAELRGYRIALEKTRVEIKAPALKRTQEIDSEARRITAALLALEDPIDAQIKAEENRKENERLAAERAEQARIEAEQQAIRAAEQKRMDEERAELARQREVLEKAERERVAKEQESRRKIEEAERQARLKIEEDERKARAIRDEQDREARVVREAEEVRLKQERDKIEAAQRAIEEKKRKEREAEEAKQREIQRQANEVLDARALLATFTKRFGHIEEFKDVIKAITMYLKKEKTK